MSGAPTLPIDLAPTNPYSLPVGSPVLVAPGCVVRDLDTAKLGALVTRTATLHTRRGPIPQAAAAPAGIVVSLIPTVGIRTLLKEESRRWERSPLPIVVSLQGDAVELGEMAALLDNVEGVAGLLVYAEASTGDSVARVRRATQLPILAMLSHGSNLVSNASDSVAAGADALVVAAAPRAGSASDPAINGFLLGPATLPLMLGALGEVRAAVRAPLIAFGGIATVEHAAAALAQGASAIMVEAARWGDPHAPARIAQGLREPSLPPAPSAAHASPRDTAADAD